LTSLEKKRDRLNQGIHSKSQNPNMKAKKPLPTTSLLNPAPVNSRGAGVLVLAPNAVEVAATGTTLFVIVEAVLDLGSAAPSAGTPPAIEKVGNAPSRLAAGKLMLVTVVRTPPGSV
jgi:hypothetical protein